MTPRHHLIIDCDPGSGVPFSDVDDGLAIALALAHSDVHVDGITIVAGNTPRELGYASAAELVSLAKTHTPIFVGADDPPGGDDTVWRPLLDDRRDTTAWKNEYGGSIFIAPTGHTTPREAVDFLVDTVNGSPGQITIAALGPLTNIAAAIRRDPGFVRAVKHIAVMGGAFLQDSLPQELNFGYDPAAAHIVMTSGADLSLIPFDVTSTTLLTHQQLELLDEDDPLQAFLKATTSPWMRYTDSRFGLGGCYLHDPLVIASLIDPSLVTWKTASVDVVLADPVARGRPIRWDPQGTIFGGGSQVLPQIGSVNIAESVDRARFAGLLIDTLAGFRVR